MTQVEQSHTLTASAFTEDFNTSAAQIMGQLAVSIPEKLYFKIGEVCDLVGVQAHVLRYWETEFPTLSPQKNRSGQRSYRRRDVESALRIKELLYDEMFTIAGAKKKLQTESKEGSKLKIVRSAEPEVSTNTLESDSPSLFDGQEIDSELSVSPVPELDGKARESLKVLAVQLLELRDMLSKSDTSV